MNTTAFSFLVFGAMVMAYAIVITVVDGEDPAWLLLDAGVLIGAFFTALGWDDTQARRRPAGRVVQAPPPPLPFWAAQDLAPAPEPQPEDIPTPPPASPARRLHLSRVVAWWVTTRITQPATPAPYRTPPPRIRPEEPSAPPVAHSSRPYARHRRTGGPR